MYSWALDGVPLDHASQVVFVCLAQHIAAYGLAHDIEQRYAPYRPQVCALDEVTAGQACTVLAARGLIDAEAGLVVFNSDTWFRSSIRERLPQLERECDGVIGVFEAEGDHWSFARVDASGRVVETAEKRRISQWATTGLYHFSRAADFFHHADAMVRAGDTTRGEYYIAPLYNRLIAAGADIRMDVADEVQALGTPEELATFLADHS